MALGEPAAFNSLFLLCIVTDHLPLSPLSYSLPFQQHILMHKESENEGTEWKGIKEAPWRVDVERQQVKVLLDFNAQFNG